MSDSDSDTTNKPNPGNSEPPTVHRGKMNRATSAEDAEQRAGFKAKRLNRGELVAASYGELAKEPIIVLAYRVGPEKKDLEYVLTFRSEAPSG